MGSRPHRPCSFSLISVKENGTKRNRSLPGAFLCGFFVFDIGAYSGVRLEANAVRRCGGCSQGPFVVAGTMIPLKGYWLESGARWIPDLVGNDSSYCFSI